LFQHCDELRANNIILWALYRSVRYHTLGTWSGPHFHLDLAPKISYLFLRM
jgi:hypothetical protein